MVAFFGGIVGGVTAGVLEYSTMRRLGTLPMLAVGLIEEAAKLIAPLVVLLFTRYRRPADGLLVGVAAGAGFAVLETMGYAFVTLIQSGGNLAGRPGNPADPRRAEPGRPHGVDRSDGRGAVAGWRPGGGRRRQCCGSSSCSPSPSGLHTAWDSMRTTPGYAVVAALSLILLIVTTHRLHVQAHQEEEAYPGAPATVNPAWRRHIGAR